MSLLDQLWDDTVAGPCPDSGLGKLRKRSSFGFRSNDSSSSSSSSSSSKEMMDRNARSVGENVSEDPVRVTRSIMIMKPQIGEGSDQTAGTPPASPAGSTPPVSPLSGGSAFRYRRRSTSDAYEKASGVGSRSPCPSYDM